MKLPRIALFALVAVCGTCAVRAQENPPCENGVACCRGSFDRERADFEFAKVGTPLLGREECLVVCRSRSIAHARLFLDIESPAAGDREILVTNDLVDNHTAFAAVEAAGTLVSIGASYLFHRYGHHKLERWTSIVHIGLTTTGTARNYCLKTAHPKTAP